MLDQLRQSLQFMLRQWYQIDSTVFYVQQRLKGIACKETVCDGILNGLAVQAQQTLPIRQKRNKM